MNYKFTFKKSFVIIFLILNSLVSLAQEDKIELKGTVITKANEPIPGASVVIKGTSSGTSTDFDGHFSLKVLKGSTIDVSMMGYQTKTYKIDNQTKLQIILEEEQQFLDEIVVTALGIKREEKALGYAVQNVEGNSLQTVKGVNVGTSLTGKVSGLNVMNSTEFGDEPTIILRGEKPLLVVDGIPYESLTLGDIPSDNIEGISVLKGATASALYGSRGQSGAIMITTKKGNEEGFRVSFNSSSMFAAGYLAIPEMQSVYGRALKQNPDGTLEVVGTGDGSWGPALEGQMVNQWNPKTKKMEIMPYLPKGANNFKNFLENGYILNNNISISQKGKMGNIRASATWINNKGVYPNSILDKYNYSVGGDINVDKFSFSTNISYGKSNTDNLGFNGYRAYDPMYSMLIWGSPDWDVRDYKDYWIKPNEVQNNSYTSDLNNPYFDRYERIHPLDKDIFNGSMEMKYEATSWLNSILRIGYDTYSNQQEVRISQGSFVNAGTATVMDGGTEIWGESREGSFNTGISRGYSINSDFITSATHSFSDFVVDGFLGGSISYFQNEGLEAHTRNGLSVPGYYSINSSVNPLRVGSVIYQKQTNSLYGRAGLSWKNMLFGEITLRNDWVSTLPEQTRSFSYPSVSSSFVVSELLQDVSWLTFWKIRGSWVTAKKTADIYSINSVYDINSDAWGNLSSSSVSSTIRGTDILPESTTTFEIGTAASFLENRVSLDFAYYSKKAYDFIRNAGISEASGYYSNYINTDEEITRKGYELTLNFTPIKTENLRWDMSFNWSKYADYYTKLDTAFTPDNPWIKVGERADPFVYNDFLRNPQTGQIIHNSSGLPEYSQFASKLGNSGPDWLWGFGTNLSYKNWQFGLSMDGRVGGLIATTTEMYMWNSGNHPKSVTQERYLDAQDPNTKNYIGEGVKVVSGSAIYDTYGNIVSDNRVYEQNDIATTYNSYTTSFHKGNAWGGSPSPSDIYSGTFLKLREISVTYNFTESVYSKIKATNMSVSAVGQNLLLWSKDFKYSDPDGGYENFSDPSQRYIGLNLKVDF